MGGELREEIAKGRKEVVYDQDEVRDGICNERFGTITTTILQSAGKTYSGACMLTIFTIPKPFAGHIGLIQRNAIRSWLALRPKCEVVLFGDEEGTASCAQDFGLRHIPGIACTKYGTPLLDDAFRQAGDTAQFPYLCYVNADIILPMVFTECVRRLAILPAFLMIGQRVDTDVAVDLDFADPACRSTFEAEVLDKGRLHPPLGSDYFVFPRGVLGDLPPFAVGRPGWDNWMIFHARQLRLPVVDASRCVLVVHQNHTYRHVPEGAGVRWEGPEANRNRELMSAAAQYFSPRYATWQVTGDRLAKRHWWTRDGDAVLGAAEVFHPWTRPLLPLASLLFRVWNRIARRLAHAAGPAGAGIE